MRNLKAGLAVLFFSSTAYASSRALAHSMSGEPMAATIAHVIHENMVNLSVLDHNGEQFNVTSVPIYAHGAQTPSITNGGFYAVWMPNELSVSHAPKDNSLHNVETLAAMQEARAGNLERFDSLEALMNSLNDGDIIYKDDNGLSVLACTSISLDGNPPQSFEPGHSYLVGLNGNGGSQIDFQLGPVPDNGVNGVTNEALLAIVIHRTKILNDKFPCDENQRAIIYMENALALFEQRTKNRKARGVEGKLEV